MGAAKKTRGGGAGRGPARQLQQRHHPAQYLNLVKAAPPIIAVVAVAAALWLGPRRWTTVQVPPPPDWTAGYECGPQHTQHFSEFPAQGLHVLQLAEPDSACSQRVVSSGATEAATATLLVHVDDLESESPVTTIEAACSPADATMEDWLFGAVREIVAQNRPQQWAKLRSKGTLSKDTVQFELAADYRVGLDRWAAFTPYGSPAGGTPAEVLTALLKCGTLYLIEGGQFVWPGVRVGHNWSVPTSDPVVPEVTVTTLSLQPRLFTVEPLLTEHERNWIKAQAPDARNPGGRTAPTVLPEGSKQAMAVIERRMHNVVRLPVSHGETIQVMKYQQNQSYGNHHDYFEAVSTQRFSIQVLFQGP